MIAIKKKEEIKWIYKKNIYLSLSYRNYQYILHPRIPTLIEFFFAILLNILSSLRRMLTKAGRRSSWDQSGCGRISFMYLWSPRHPMVAGSYGATFRRLCATSASRCGKNCCWRVIILLVYLLENNLLTTSLIMPFMKTILKVHRIIVKLSICSLILQLLRDK